MGHPNLPDDWGSYFSTCSTCGERYHASGTDECACVCVDCDTNYPGDLNEAGLCVECAKKNPHAPPLQVDEPDGEPDPDPEPSDYDYDRIADVYERQLFGD